MAVLVLDNKKRVIALPRGGGSGIWAHLLERGVLHSAPTMEEMWAGGPHEGDARVVMWSGSMGDTLFADDPRTWGPRGWGALHAACDAMAPELARTGTTACFRTHARHVLSDVPACARFVKDRGEACFAVLLEPGAMLAESMRATAEDHVRRMLEGAPAVGTVAGIVVSGALGPQVELAVELARKNLPAAPVVVDGDERVLQRVERAMGRGGLGG